jgi:acetolactate synthase-1/2/3 large subunit
MNVAQAVGARLVAHGVARVFGLVGSGNFHVTNALVAAGAVFVPAMHEGGAASMADAYARVSGRLGVLSVHQGPGLTNALTGIAEAAKSHTPLVVLAPEATNPVSNFYLDLEALAASVGAGYRRVRAEQVIADVDAACAEARTGVGRTVILGLPLDVQAATAPAGATPAPAATELVDTVNADGVEALLAAVRAANRPVFIAGRGATRPADGARAAIAGFADHCGALLAVSAAAKGLFAGNPWYLDVSGGFATPLAAELISRADLVVAWGSTLNMWTTRHGRLIGPDAVVAQVDLEPAALGSRHRVDLPVTGDVAAVARACLDRVASSAPRTGWRTDEVRHRIATEGRWRDIPYRDLSDEGRIDPRTLSIELDDLLPAQRTLAVDSGNFMGYPAMFLSVPDQVGFCFTQAYQSIGLGLASAIGAAVARPDRLTVAAVGDGGFLMSVAELTTAVRLAPRLLIVVYNDAAYGAEVHHFGPHGYPLDTVTYADPDLGAIAAGFGCAAITVRGPADLAGVRDWLSGRDSRPLVVDAKVVASQPSWWLEEAFRGH